MEGIQISSNIQLYLSTMHLAPLRKVNSGRDFDFSCHSFNIPFLESIISPAHLSFPSTISFCKILRIVQSLKIVIDRIFIGLPTLVSGYCLLKVQTKYRARKWWISFHSFSENNIWRSIFMSVAQVGIVKRLKNCLHHWFIFWDFMSLQVFIKQRISFHYRKKIEILMWDSLASRFLRKIQSCLLCVINMNFDETIKTTVRGRLYLLSVFSKFLVFQ